MSKCENCISQNVCRWWENGMGKNLNCTDEVVCPEYKDKSLFVELPCRCYECEHLTVINSNKIYAKCEKTGLEFLPFEIDTREHYCSFAKLKEKKNEE